MKKTVRFFRSTVTIGKRFWIGAIALFPCLPAMADPLAGATMAVFEANGPREVELASTAMPTLTVFTPDGAREVDMQTNWPEIQGAGHLGISVGPRYDRAAFAIGGHGSANILSELQWKVPAAEIRVDGQWTHTSGFSIKGHLAYAAAVSGGEVRDSDYVYDDRQGEFSRSYANPDESRMFDISLGAGWRLPLGSTLALTPMFGVARYDSEYRQRDGDLTVWTRDYAKQLGPYYDYDQPLGRFTNLHSSYKPVWRSNWLGVDGEFKPSEQFTLRAGIKQHWFRYQAEANWNLRGSFAHPVSFLHQGHGQGWEADLGADWRLLGGHRLSLDLGMRELRVKDGTDTTFFYNGTSSEITLRTATSDSWSARLGYRYEF